MDTTIEALVNRLTDKSNPAAYQALRQLQRESAESDRVHPFLNRFAELMDSGNSYQRTRGLLLIAGNARWDRDNRVDELIDRYLKHITDPKPITARQCIGALPLLARYKPELRPVILAALHGANVSRYPESMQSLVWKDIRQALEEIEEMGEGEVRE